jgi:hypothetical protein
MAEEVRSRFVASEAKVGHEPGGTGGKGAMSDGEARNLERLWPFIHPIRLEFIKARIEREYRLQVIRDIKQMPRTFAIPYFDDSVIEVQP